MTGKAFKILSKQINNELGNLNEFYFSNNPEQNRLIFKCSINKIRISFFSLRRY